MVCRGLTILRIRVRRRAHVTTGINLRHFKRRSTGTNVYDYHVHRIRVVGLRARTIRHRHQFSANARNQIWITSIGNSTGAPVVRDANTNNQPPIVQRHENTIPRNRTTLRRIRRHHINNNRNNNVTRLYLIIHTRDVMDHLHLIRHLNVHRNSNTERHHSPLFCYRSVLLANIRAMTRRVMNGIIINHHTTRATKHATSRVTMMTKDRRRVMLETKSQDDGRTTARAKRIKNDWLLDRRRVLDALNIRTILMSTNSRNNTTVLLRWRLRNRLLIYRINHRRYHVNGRQHNTPAVKVRRSTTVKDVRMRIGMMTNDRVLKVSALRMAILRGRTGTKRNTPHVLNGIVGRRLRTIGSRENVRQYVSLQANANANVNRTGATTIRVNYHVIKPMYTVRLTENKRIARQRLYGDRLHYHTRRQRNEGDYRRRGHQRDRNRDTVYLSFTRFRSVVLRCRGGCFAKGTKSFSRTLNAPRGGKQRLTDFLCRGRGHDAGVLRNTWL